MDSENQSPTPSQTPLGQPLGLPDDAAATPTPPTEPIMPNEQTPPTEPITPKEPEPQAAPDITIEKKKDKPASKKNGGKKWLIAMLVALVIAGGGAAAYFFLYDKDSRTTKHDKDEEKDTDNDEDMDDDDDVYAIDDEDINGTGDNDNVYGTDDEDATVDEADNMTDTEPAATPSTADDTQRSFTLTGDADGYPLTLNLTIDNQQVSGTYKDETAGTTLNVSGQMGNDVIMLTGRSANKTYTFRIVPEGRIYTGTFSQTGGRTLELHLTKKQ